MCDDALLLLDRLRPADVTAGEQTTQTAVLGALKQVHDYRTCSQCGRQCE